MRKNQYWQTIQLFGGRPTSAIRLLLVVCGIAFIFQQLDFLSGSGQLTYLLGLQPFYIWNRLQLWRLFTYLFLHGDFFHIIFNLLTLYFFGPELERLWGTARFYRFYFITGVGAGLFVVLAEPYSSAVTVGASGAIYGLLVAFAVNFPNRLIYLYAVFPIRAKYLMIGIFCLAFFASLSGSGGKISHLAHLGGGLVGYLYLRAWILMSRWNNFWQERKREQSRRKFHVYYQERQRTNNSDDPGSHIIH